MAAPDDEHDFQIDQYVPSSQNRPRNDDSVMRLLIARQEGRNNHRGMVKNVSSRASSEPGFGTEQRQKPGGEAEKMKTPPPTALPTIRGPELSLMHLECQSNDAEEVFTAVVDAVTSMPNTDFVTFPGKAKVIGNYYDSCTYCEFLLGIYSLEDGDEEKTVIDMRRMTGMAFAFDSLFRLMAKSLTDANVVVNEDDEEESSELDFLLSDDEDEEIEEQEASSLAKGAFLRLSYDPQLVSVWVQRMKNRSNEDQLHVGGLMAHNSHDEDNLRIMLETEQDEIKKMLKEKLVDNQHIAALAFFLSKFLENITHMVEAFVDNELLVQVLVVLSQWRLYQAKKDLEVTESRGVMRNLCQVLNNTLKANPEMFNETLGLNPVDPHVKSNYLTFIQEDNAEDEEFYDALRHIVEFKE